MPSTCCVPIVTRCALLRCCFVHVLCCGCHVAGGIKGCDGSEALCVVADPQPNLDHDYRGHPRKVRTGLRHMPLTCAGRSAPGHCHM